MTIYLFYFLTFSFFGWMLEVVYAAIKRGRFVNRGFNFGPVCTIYGACAVLLRLCLAPLSDRWLLLFLAAVGFATGVELITGFLMDRIFETKWWDYSAHRLNIGGYVCLRFSLYWGFLGTVMVKLLFPAMDWIFSLLPLLVWQIVLWLLAAVLLVDVALSVMGAFHLKLELRMLKEMRDALTRSSDTIGKGVYISTVKLEEQYRRLAQKCAKAYRRVLEAFPSMQVRDGVDIGFLRELLERGGNKLFGKDAVLADTESKSVGDADDPTSGGKENSTSNDTEDPAADTADDTPGTEQTAGVSDDTPDAEQVAS